MKPEQQRIAIAEACGYKWMTKHGSYTTHHFARYKPADVAELLSCGFVEGKCGTANDCDVYGLDMIPDYLNDLNAMHIVEKSLDDERLKVYRLELMLLVGGHIHFCATAAQRAEVFLRALNLYTE